MGERGIVGEMVFWFWRILQRIFWQRRVLRPVCQQHSLVLAKGFLLWLCCFLRSS